MTALKKVGLLFQFDFHLTWLLRDKSITPITATILT